MDEHQLYLGFRYRGIQLRKIDLWVLPVDGVVWKVFYNELVERLRNRDLVEIRTYEGAGLVAKAD